MGAVRILAGFDPESRKAFHIDRDALQPPPELAQQVFPELNQWQWRFSNVGHPMVDVEDTHTARGFLKTMDYLRIVFLQDSVFLSELWPHLGIWNTQLFHTEVWKDWAARLKAATAESLAVRESNKDIEVVVPMIAEGLERQERRLAELVISSEDDIQQHTTKELEPLHRRVLMLEEMISKGWTVSVMPAAHSPTATAPGLVQEPQDDDPAVPQAVGLLTDSLSRDPAQLQVSTRKAKATVDPASFPFRSMDRSVRTVPLLWQEWMVGTPTRIPVEEMDRRYGRKWLESDSAKTWHKRRRVIISYIQAHPLYAMSGPHAAVEVVERERGDQSLDGFSKDISRTTRPL